MFWTVWGLLLCSLRVAAHAVKRATNDKDALASQALLGSILDPNKFRGILIEPSFSSTLSAPQETNLRGCACSRKRNVLRLRRFEGMRQKPPRPSQMAGPFSMPFSRQSEHPKVRPNKICEPLLPDGGLLGANHGERAWRRATWSKRYHAQSSQVTLTAVAGAAADCGGAGSGGGVAGQAPRSPRPTRHPNPIHLPRPLRGPSGKSKSMRNGSPWRAMCEARGWDSQNP